MDGSDAKSVALGLIATSFSKLLFSAWIRHNRKAKFVRVGTVSEVNCYPVKSCQAIPVQSAELKPLGIYVDGVADRSWMFARSDGAFLSQRQCPKMALIKVSCHDDMIHLDAPGMSTLKLPKHPKVDPQRCIDCRVWGLSLPGMDCGEEANKWACDFLDQKNLHVVFSAPEMSKKNIYSTDINPWTDRVRPEDKSIFSDLTAYLVLTKKSLDAVNERLDTPVSMRNFRPNIVIDCTKGAFEEDLWAEIQFGEDSYMRCQIPCPRCLLPCVDPDTGKKDPNREPYTTLKKFRCLPGFGIYPYFGIYGAVDIPGKIRVGDPVYAFYRRK